MSYHVLRTLDIFCDSQQSYCLVLKLAEKSFSKAEEVYFNNRTHSFCYTDRDWIVLEILITQATLSWNLSFLAYSA